MVLVMLCTEQLTTNLLLCSTLYSPRTLSLLSSVSSDIRVIAGRPRPRHARRLGILAERREKTRGGGGGLPLSLLTLLLLGLLLTPYS